MIDWPNIVATVAAAVIGGWIAARIAQRQTEAMQQVELQKFRSHAARELIEAVDSYVHIAYRSKDEAGKLERQRLRRRIVSLTAEVLPEKVEPVQEHLDGIEKWWRAKRGGLAPKGMGYTATEIFFDGFKEDLFEQVFGKRMTLTPLVEEMEGNPVS